MRSQNLNRRVSDSSFHNSNNNNPNGDRRRQSNCKFHDLTNAETQPRVFTSYNQEHNHNPVHGKLNKSGCHYSYGNQSEEECRGNKRVRFTDCKHGQEEEHRNGNHQQQSLPCEIRVIKVGAQNGKGNWDLACALAYRHLFGVFVAQNEDTDCNSTSSSSSSESSVDSVNFNQGRGNSNDDGVNFVLYLLSGSTNEIEFSRNEASGEQLALPDVVNPTQAAHHWLYASQGMRNSQNYLQTVQILPRLS